MTLYRPGLIAACALSLCLGALAFSGSAGHAAAAKKERTAISKECSTKADGQKLKGKERRAFRRKCMKEG